MKKLVRSSNKMFGGVLGGIADYFDIDATWLRLGVVLLALIYSPPIILVFYLVGLFLVPNESNVSKTDSEYRKGTSNSGLFNLLGLLLIGLGVMFLLEQLLDFEIWDYLNNFFSELRKYIVPVLLIFLGGWIIFRRKKS